MLDACYDASFALYDELAQSNANFKKVYEAWKPFRQSSESWLRIAEYSYDAYVYQRSRN